MSILARFILLLLATMSWATARSQNLVVNGSFEEYVECPVTFGFAHYVAAWENLHTHSADYFHRCQPNTVAGVPYNTCGYQEPAHGDGYVGLVTTFPGLPWYREIVGTELIEPLQPGVPVCLSFSMAIGGFGSWNGGSAVYTAKGVGLRFFNGFPDDWTTYLYPNEAALALDILPTDTSIWYTVRGEYVPDSAYTHLAIGNFFTDTLSEVALLDSSGYGIFSVSYAFIDDVRVSQDLDFCGTTGIGPNQAMSGSHIRAYPVPFVDHFTVALGRRPYGEVEWRITDVCGKALLNGSSQRGTDHFTVSVGSVSSAVYILCVTDEMGAFAPIRLFSVSR